jgi:chemotaxis protein MotB
MSPRAHRGRVNHERWLVSYADFITLLFAFFVVLYAFAKADQKKQAQVSASIDTALNELSIIPNTAHAQSNAFGAAGAGTRTTAIRTEVMVSPTRVKNDLDRIRRELEQSLSSQIAQHTVSIQMGRDGLVISLREAGFFDSGSANPRPGTLNTLRKIADTLGRTPYDVRVEGHTDNVPIHNAAFESNWELSSARATRIARIFLELDAIPPDRISAAGYAEFHPIAGNDSEEGRAENRRVDLVVIPRTQFDFAASASAPSFGRWQKITDDDVGHK